MQVRYRYQFRRHPEVWGYDPLSMEDVKRLLNVCRKNNIKLVPKMNLIGHQSGFPNEPTDGILHGHNQVLSDIPDALLRAYPNFDEQRGTNEILYSRSICLSSIAAKGVVCELIDELMDAFEADEIHIGCDEVFNAGLCPECSKKTRAELISSWINSLNDHVKRRGGATLIWGDRLLCAKKTGYNRWEASDDGSEGAINMLSKDITVCDWHYDKYEKYSVGKLDQAEVIEKNMILLGISRKLFTHSLPLVVAEQCYIKLLKDIRALIVDTRIIKKKGNIILYPEGMSSISGANQPVAVGTGKFIKHFKLPVYYSLIKGGYLTSPKYDLDERLGKVEVEYDILDGSKVWLLTKK